MTNQQIDNNKTFKFIEISPEERKKIDKDLEFINLVSEIANNNGMRAVIAGGYAVDGFIGRITRPHNDIDIQLYGNGPDGKAQILRLMNLAKEENGNYSQLEEKIDHGRKTYYYGLLAEQKGFGADFYYIQVEGDPFADEKVVIKNNEEKTPPHKFNTIKVELEEVSFEAQNPETELKDKLEKRDKGEKQRDEIDQDIHNLKLLLENT
jgi:hypothetical protein